jgi:NADPH-dependent 2,4-dienoyl-CoA reductase/sulfur reductase-like enzyme/nitrite reductase/ring-hydroxylating ferredoxin subunit
MAEEEFDVCAVSEVIEGEMHEFPSGDSNVLLTKEGKEIYAVASKCSHLGAPLKSGVYSNGRVRCPWHGACFSTKTGDVEDFPCSDGISAYKVRVANGRVFVKGTPESFKSHKRTMNMCKKDAANSKVFLILGGGPAGITCAEGLRRNGFTGRVIIVCKEKALPYDRTKLSKAMSSPADAIALRKKEFLDQHGIEALVGVEATALDTVAKKVTLSNGSTQAYDGLLIATGTNARLLPIPGKDLKHIYPVRVTTEANEIVKHCEGKKVVIVGSSFIGMEAASCISKKAASVVVIGMEAVPFERVLGAQVGAVLQKLHETNNISFRLNQKPVKEFHGKDGNVSAVVLDSGEVLPAELVILGAGVIPATDFIKDIPKFRDGSIVVDEFFRVPDKPGVYVAGDIARFPYWLTGESVRVEHYGMAMYQGETVAKHFNGKPQPARSVPFFWTVLYGKSLRYAGHATSYDDIILHGDVPGMAFVAYYCRAGQVISVSTMGKDPYAAAAAELLGAKKMPDAATLKKGPVDLPALAAKVLAK